MVNMTSGNKHLDTEDSSLPQETHDSYLSPVPGSGAYVEPLTPEMYIEPHNPQRFSNFLRRSIRGKQSDDKQPHSYVEVIELGEMDTKGNIRHVNPDNVHRLSSSYDDVMWKDSTAGCEIDSEKDENYLDAVFL
jgi:hypothetical protein